MGALEAIKKGFKVAKELVPLMTILFVFNATGGMLMLGIVGQQPTPEKVTQVVPAILLLFAGIILAWIFLEGGLFSSMISGIKNNESQMGAFLSNCFKFFARLFGMNLLSGGIVIGLWFIVAILIAVFVAMGGGKNVFFNAIGVILFLTALLISLLISIPLFMSHYILIADDGRIIASIKKSIFLFKQYFWRIILLFFLLALIIISISLLLNLISILVSKIIPAGWIFAMINISLTSLVNSAVSIFSGCTILSLILSVSSVQLQKEGTGEKQS